MIKVILFITVLVFPTSGHDYYVWKTQNQEFETVQQCEAAVAALKTRIKEVDTAQTSLTYTVRHDCFAVVQ